MKVEIEFLVDDDSGEVYCRVSSPFGRGIVNQDGEVERGRDAVDACTDTVIGALQEWFKKDEANFGNLNADKLRGQLLNPPHP